MFRSMGELLVVALGELGNISRRKFCPAEPRAPVCTTSAEGSGLVVAQTTTLFNRHAMRVPRIPPDLFVHAHGANTTWTVWPIVRHRSRLAVASHASAPSRRDPLLQASVKPSRRQQMAI